MTMGFTVIIDHLIDDNRSGLSLPGRHVLVEDIPILVRSVFVVFSFSSPTLQTKPACCCIQTIDNAKLHLN